MSTHIVLCDVFIWTDYSCTCISISIERYHFSANQHGCLICVEKVACKRVRYLHEEEAKGWLFPVCKVQSQSSGASRFLTAKQIRPSPKGRLKEVSCSQRGKADRHCCCLGGLEGLSMTAARLGLPVLAGAVKGDRQTHLRYNLATISKNLNGNILGSKQAELNRQHWPTKKTSSLEKKLKPRLQWGI